MRCSDSLSRRAPSRTPALHPSPPSRSTSRGCVDLSAQRGGPDQDPLTQLSAPGEFGSHHRRRRGNTRREGQRPVPPAGRSVRVNDEQARRESRGAPLNVKFEQLGTGGTCRWLRCATAATRAACGLGCGPCCPRPRTRRTTPRRRVHDHALPVARGANLMPPPPPHVVGKRDGPFHGQEHQEQLRASSSRG